MKFYDQIQEVINSFNENKHNFPSNRSLWEFLKQNLSCVSKSYSIRKSAKERSKIEEVRYNFEVLESININDRTESVEKVLNELKNFEKEYISKRIQGTLLRSKLPGVDEGDLNLAYYTKLEKLKAEQNTIYSLENNDGMLVEGTEQILDANRYPMKQPQGFACGLSVVQLLCRRQGIVFKQMHVAVGLIRQGLGTFQHVSG